jgi:nitroimidazol reductase NimA-like FMN-containing flavoprotein (pyridoxamine 5'-phosphate oxidase superfamily)
MTPVTDLDARYSDPQASPTDWPRTLAELSAAELYWLTTVRPDGRPHVTPLIGVVVDEVVYFTTGADERKARNLEQNPHVVVTTGRNLLHEGLDVVVEGDAARVGDDRSLTMVATAFLDKYGEEWHFEVRDGAFHHPGGRALVFAVAPTTVFGFAKGGYAQTRYRF